MRSSSYNFPNCLFQISALQNYVIFLNYKLARCLIFLAYIQMIFIHIILLSRIKKLIKKCEISTISNCLKPVLVATLKKSKNLLRSFNKWTALSDDHKWIFKKLWHHSSPSVHLTNQKRCLQNSS